MRESRIKGASFRSKILTTSSTDLYLQLRPLSISETRISCQQKSSLPLTLGGTRFDFSI